MGSLLFPPSPSPVNPPSGHRIYASFCSREADPNLRASNWLEYYDPRGNTWNYVSSVPALIEEHVLKGFAMTSIGGKLYIIGGRLCRRLAGRVQSSGNESDHDNFGTDLEVLSSVLCYNVRTDEWSQCAPLSVPRYDFACTVCEGKIYVCGGQSTLASARGISSAEVYDPLLDNWTPLPNMNRLRYKCVGVTWQGRVHVVGGFVQSYNIDRCSAEVYNVQSGKWDLVPGMWQLDVPPNQIVALDDTLFSSGDCLNSWKGHIESFDGNLGIWNVVEGSQVKIFPSPISTHSDGDGDGGEENPYSQRLQRLYLTMAAIKGHLFFLAGYKMAGGSSSSSSKRTVSMVHSFDTSAESESSTADDDGYAWRSFEPMQEEGERELCSHCCVVQLL